MKQLLLLISGIIGFTVSSAQTVAIGDWETHYSYSSAQSVVSTGNRIFCASYNGLFSVDPSNGKFRIFSKNDGLSDVGVSSMGYDHERRLLILGYRNGNIDLLYLNDLSEPSDIINLPLLISSPDLPETRRINKIVFRDGLFYLGTNFGIVVLNPDQREIEETYRYIGTEGLEADVRDITFTSDSLFAVTAQGITGTSMAASVNRQNFANWKIISSPAKPLALISYKNILYAGFSDGGIYIRDLGKWSQIYKSDNRIYSLTASADNIIGSLDSEVISINNENETLSIKNPLFKSPIESLETAPGIFWIADHRQGLISNVNDTYTIYGPALADTTIAIKPDSSIIDQNGLTWTRLPAYLGGGISVKNISNRQERILSTLTGNGGLPSSVINSLVTDMDGYVWFGSDRGVGYFVTDEILTIGRIDAILPVYGQRKLFNNERCTALAVEPGNRKWIGTGNGLYCFNGDGTELVSHFTADNSPLPANEITTLEFESETGMLFVDTPNGMVSYRSGASAAAENFSAVTIFPNPVKPGYSGNLGIKGLTSNSSVKITTLSGRLVYETKSQGGTASWNLNDYTGRRASAGIYLIMTISEDKVSKFAGKFALID